MEGHKNGAISVVDITDIGLEIPEPPLGSYEKVAKLLDSAFSTIGFVYLTGHGVDEGNVIEKAMQVSREFFEGEVAEKENISRKSPLSKDGWVAEGRELFGQAENKSRPTHEIREAFDINGFGPEAHFPSRRPEFKENLELLANRTKILIERLLSCLSLALGKNSDYFIDLHKRVLGGGNASAIRSLYYPAINESQIPDGHQRCSEHTDYGTLTLLYTDHHPGLQVKTSSGSWVSADPMSGAILINIGDLLQVWSGGRYPATLHRVVILDDPSSRSEARQSIAFFVHPDNEVVVEPVGREEGSKMYQAVRAVDHVQTRFAATYQY